MELIVYGALSTLVWMSSVTVFLPFLLLLKFNKAVRDKFFSTVFIKVLGPLIVPKLEPVRRRAFELLTDHLKRDGRKKPLEVLEIGIGYGANLEYYPKNSNLTALDMNKNFETSFRKTRKEYPQVTYKESIIATAEKMDMIPDSSMDIVVCTYVLCSVKSVRVVLNEVQRVLKPGGKFLFVEHVVFPSSEWGSTIQRFISPLWKIYFNGCLPDRNTAENIHKAGFSSVECERKQPPSLMLFVRPQIVGIATK